MSLSEEEYQTCSDQGDQPVIDKIQPRLHTSHTGDSLHVEGRSPASADKGRRVDDTSAEVHLSQAALDLQRAVQAAQDAPDIREDVVDRIRTQIETGTYEIDAQALARRLIQLLNPEGG